MVSAHESVFRQGLLGIAFPGSLAQAEAALRLELKSPAGSLLPLPGRWLRRVKRLRLLASPSLWDFPMWALRHGGLLVDSNLSSTRYQERNYWKETTSLLWHSLGSHRVNSAILYLLAQVKSDSPYTAFFLKTGSDYVAQASLGLESSCLSLLNAGIIQTGVSLCTRL
jgi:hypothetical protein